MKYIPLISLTAAAVMLTACAENESSSSVVSVTKTISAASATEIVTTAPDQTEPSVTTTRKKNPKLLTVDVISYDGETLTYEYENEQKTAALTRKEFTDYEPSLASIPGLIQYSQVIINNRFGVPVKADIRLNDDKTAVTYCNVFDKNVEICSVDKLAEEAGVRLAASDYPCTMERVSGSVYKISNKAVSITADVNDLDNWGKINFGSKAENVDFRAFRFASGDYLLTGIGFITEISEDSISSESPGIVDKTAFFGTVKSLSADRASVLLTDDKTTCDVPTYFNDGELKEGMDVMLVLDADTSLFGSGQSFKDDYAVFYTEPVSLLPKGKKDITLFAYAKCSETQYGKFDCVEISELGTSDEN